MEDNITFLFNRLQTAINLLVVLDNAGELHLPSKSYWDCLVRDVRLLLEFINDDLEVTLLKRSKIFRDLEAVIDKRFAESKNNERK